eukprot:g5561.t1
MARSLLKEFFTVAAEMTAAGILKDEDKSLIRSMCMDLPGRREAARKKAMEQEKEEGSAGDAKVLPVLPVVVAGASGFKTDINGTYDPVHGELHNGKVLYRKRNDDNTWLRCAKNGHWSVGATKDKDDNNTLAFIYTAEKGLDGPTQAAWKTNKGVQPSITCVLDLVVQASAPLTLSVAKTSFDVGKEITFARGDVSSKMAGLFAGCPGSSLSFSEGTEHTVAEVCPMNLFFRPTEYSSLWAPIRAVKGFEDHQGIWDPSQPETIVGRSILVSWNQGKWFSGVVDKYDEKKQKHHVTYADGDEKWYDMSKKTFKFVDSPKPVPKATDPKDGEGLITAARMGDTEELEALLQKGVDPNYAGEAKTTALVQAARANQLAAAESLLKHGANANKADEGNQDTALIWGCCEGNLKMVKLVLKHGGKVDVKSQNGSSPEGLASSKGHDSILTLLKEALEKQKKQQKAHDEAVAATVAKQATLDEQNLHESKDAAQIIADKIKQLIETRISEHRQDHASREAREREDEINAVASMARTRALVADLKLKESQTKEVSELQVYENSLVGLGVFKRFVQTYLRDTIGRIRLQEEIPRRHILLSGNRGTGKRTAANYLARWRSAIRKGSMVESGSAEKKEITVGTLMELVDDNVGDAKSGPLDLGDKAPVDRVDKGDNTLKIKGHWYQEKALRRVVPPDGAVEVESLAALEKAMEHDEDNSSPTYYLHGGAAPDPSKLTALLEKMDHGNKAVVIFGGPARVCEQIKTAPYFCQKQPHSISLPVLGRTELAAISMQHVQRRGYKLRVAGDLVSSGNACLKLLERVVQQKFDDDEIAERNAYLAEDCVDLAVERKNVRVQELEEARESRQKAASKQQEEHEEQHQGLPLQTLPFVLEMSDFDVVTVSKEERDHKRGEVDRKIALMEGWGREDEPHTPRGFFATQKRILLQEDEQDGSGGGVSAESAGADGSRERKPWDFNVVVEGGAGVGKSTFATLAGGREMMVMTRYVDDAYLEDGADLSAVEPSRKRFILYYYYATQIFNWRERGEMPLCVKIAVRSKYPNPAGRSYGDDDTSA